MEGRYELSSTSNGIIIFEDVVVALGSFTQTIDMWTKGKGDKWDYKHLKGKSGIKHMKMYWKGIPSAN